MDYFSDIISDAIRELKGGHTAYLFDREQVDQVLKAPVSKIGNVAIKENDGIYTLTTDIKVRDKLAKKLKKNENL